MGGSPPHAQNWTTINVNSNASTLDEAALAGFIYADLAAVAKTSCADLVMLEDGTLGIDIHCGDNCVLCHEAYATPFNPGVYADWWSEDDEVRLIVVA